MLVTASRLIGTQILNMQSVGPIGTIAEIVTDPNSLKIVAFRISGSAINRRSNILAVSSIREYSRYGMVIDSIDELVADDDIVKISKILELNFSLTGLKVETKKGGKLGTVTDFAVTSNDFIIQQIIVKRPIFKSFLDPELVIARREIAEVTDTKVIVKDDEKTIRAKATTENFVPNFVNPFRKSEQDLAPADTETPADTNKQ